MANTFKNAFSENVSNSSKTTVLTVPSANASKAVIIGCQITNTGSSEITAEVCLYDYSASTNEITLVKDVAIPANSMVSILQGDKIILEEQDELRVQSNTASACNAMVSYLLVDNT